jgi:hypothetical protein
MSRRRSEEVVQSEAARTRLDRAVREILLKEWDPVAIQELPEQFRVANADEYDAYVQPIVDMIASGQSMDALADHLHDIETRNMGRGRAAAAALKLHELEALFGRP